MSKRVWSCGVIFKVLIPIFKVDLGTPHPFYSPPSLFTPDERHHGVQRQCDERQYFTRTSNHPIRNGKQACYFTEATKAIASMPSELNFISG